MNPTQLKGLTATRGFAALFIVIFHFGLEVFPFNEIQSFFSKGNMAVSYFFTLSGFIMCYTYRQQSIAYADYLKRRIARIVPLYLFAIILIIIHPLYFYFIHGELLENNFLIKLVLNSTLLQAYIPGYALSINSPGWSLSVEFFFYLLFPLLLWLYKGNERRFVWGAVIFFIISQIVHIYLAGNNVTNEIWKHEFIYYHPFGHLSQFIIGMAGCYAMDKARKRGLKIHSLLVLAVIVLLLIYLPLSKHNGLLSPLFLLLIISIALNNKTILHTKPMVYLGEISYGIYILQMPVNYYVAWLNANLLHLSASFFFLFFVFVLILISGVCFRFIEQPLRKKINAFAT